MGVTVTIKNREGLPAATPLGYEVVASVEFDTDYASSGGETIDPHADLLLPKETTVIHASAAASEGFVFEYVGGKLIAYEGADGAPLAEAGAGENALDTVVTTLHVIAAVV